MRSFVEEEEKEGTDTEITLGMKSLLGAFFGAVLVCGVFFGFGYSLGRSSAHPAGTKDVATASPAVAVVPSADQEPSPTQTQTPARESTADAPLKTIVSDATPAESKSSTSQSASAAPDKQYEYVPTPGGPARRPIDAPPRPRTAAALTSAPVITKPSAAVVSTPVAQTAAPAPAATPKAEPAALTTTRNMNPTATEPSGNAPVSGNAPGGSTMVQIAAVTHQEDATILVSALKKRGYAVIVRNEPKDSLLHVQIGPFTSRDEARATRARLLADGYNAILK